MSKCVKCEAENKLHPFDKCIECIKYILGKPQVLISNVLAYVNSFRSGHSRLKVQLACLKGFDLKDIEDAKELLFKEYENILGTPIRRQGGSKKNISEYNIEDIYDAFTALDKKKIVVQCVADNIKLLPKFNPEELELSAILERLLKLEVKIEDHENRLDQGLAVEIKQASEIEVTKKLVQNVDNEVKNCMSIVDDTRSEVKIQENNVTSLQTVIQQEKLSFAGMVKSGRSDIQSVNRAPSGNQSQSHSINNNQISSNDGFKVVNRKRRAALVGTARPGGVGTKVMGAPPPSRHFVIERVLDETTKEDLVSYINSKDSNLEVRSLTCMSHIDSRFKKFKLEISVEDCKTIYDPDFWQWGMRVRPFYRKRNTDDEGNRFFRPREDEKDDETS